MNLEELSKQYDFTGKTAVVTGGAGVLGGEIACSLAECGANVAILDRQPKNAERILPRIESAAGKAVIIESDVLNKDALEKSAEETEE